MTDQSVSHGAARRALSSVTRNGVRGTLERIHRWGVQPLVRRVWASEEHVWVVIDTDDPGPLPDGYVLRRGGPDDLDALAAIGGIAPATARDYLDGGARLYVAMHGDDLAFATWIHVDRVPLASAPGGWLNLPPELVSFEDSISAPAHRRSGIALAGILHVTAIEKAAGFQPPISRIAADNAPARAWARKMGAQDVAVTRLRRIGPVRRVRVEPLPGGERVAELLAGQVGGR